MMDSATAPWSSLTYGGPHRHDPPLPICWTWAGDASNEDRAAVRLKNLIRVKANSKNSVPIKICNGLYASHRIFDSPARPQRV